MPLPDFTDENQLGTGGLPIPPRPGGLAVTGPGTTPPSGVADSTSSQLDEMIRGALGKVQQTDNMSTWDKLTGGRRDRRQAMESLQLLAGVRGAVGRPEDLQKQYMGLLKESAKEFATLDADTQDRMLPIFGPIIMKLNKLAGVNIDPDHLQAAFTQSGAVEAMANVYMDSQAFTPKEREAIIAGAKGQKGPALRTYYDDVVKQKIAQFTPKLKQEMPGLVAEVRRGLPDPAAPLSVSDFLSAVAKRDPSAKDPIVAQAMDLILKDDGFVENLGLISSATSKKQAEVKAEVAGAREKAGFAPERTGAEFNRFAKELYPDKRADQLTGEEAAKVNKRIEQERVGVSAAQGENAIALQQKQPLTPKERADLVDVGALEKGLDLVQPAPGTTKSQVATGGQFVAIDDKQKSKIDGLKRSRVLIDQIFGLADQVVTAKTPAEAMLQRGQGPTEAFFKSNPQAAAYQDAKTAFLGNLSRELAAERGVLTQQDIDRVGNGLPSFADTVAVREIKKGIINDIWKVARQSVVGEVSGKPQDARAKIDDLLKRLDQVSAPTTSDRVIRVQREDGKGKVMNLAPGYPMPPGWKEFKK